MKLKRKANIVNEEIKFNASGPVMRNGVLCYSQALTIGELSKVAKIPSATIIKKFFMSGKLLNLNSTLTNDELIDICLENEIDIKQEVSTSDNQFLSKLLAKDEAKELKPRPPIITIMGHVDHGKTTLIDKVRKSNIANKEVGGITQGVGAYQIEYKKKKITILDTPGHEAFTAMRLRGSQVTDIVVLVVAADDGVMAQTREAISHALNAKVTIVVFVNKIDKTPNFDKDKLFNDLSSSGLTPEEWGGDTTIIYGSGLTGEGVDKLFDVILLHSEMLELKANPNRLPYGTIIESSMDKFKGSLATIIVENGTLVKRDFIIAGSHFGRVRQLMDSNGKPVNEVTPGTPAIISGLSSNPLPGTIFVGFENEKIAKNIASKVESAEKSKALKSRSTWQASLEDSKVLNILIKANYAGSVEAIRHALGKIQNEEVSIKIVQATSGGINKSDILLASTAKAIILGFNIRPSAATSSFAKDQGVEIRTFSIIYQLTEAVEDIVNGMLAPKYEEKILGSAQILKVIYSSKFGNIAGCKVISGEVKDSSLIRLIRDQIVIHEGRIDTLRHNKDKVRTMRNGTECGIVLAKYNDIKVDDVIEAFEHVEIDKSKESKNG